MPDRHRFVAMAALAFLPLMLMLSGCGGAKKDDAKAEVPHGPPAAPVVTAVAAAKDVPLELRAIGAIRASSTVAVKSRIGGALAEVHFTEGEEVAQDQLLFTIDARPLEQALKQAQAALEQARAVATQAEAALARDQVQSANAEREAERYAGLVASGVTTKDQVEQLRAAADAARATLDVDRAAIATAKASASAAEASAEAARLQLDYCSIRAPVAGRTGMLAVHAGNLVSANDTVLVTINRMRPIQAVFSVPEAELGELRERRASGELAVSAAPSTSGGSWRREGKLDLIDNQVAQATGTIALRAIFSNDDSFLWPGQFVDIVLTLGTDHGAITVPSQAVQTGQRGDYVYVVSPDQTAEARPVTVARIVGPDAVIASGLAAGETVVVDGQLRVLPGGRVGASDADRGTAGSKRAGSATDKAQGAAKAEAAAK